MSLGGREFVFTGCDRAKGQFTMTALRAARRKEHIAVRLACQCRETKALPVGLVQRTALQPALLRFHQPRALLDARKECLAAPHDHFREAESTGLRDPQQFHQMRDTAAEPQIGSINAESHDAILRSYASAVFAPPQFEHGQGKEALAICPAVQLPIE